MSGEMKVVLDRDATRAMEKLARAIENSTKAMERLFKTNEISNQLQVERLRIIREANVRQREEESLGENA
jgi:hypothetical protein